MPGFPITQRAAQATTAAYYIITESTTTATIPYGNGDPTPTAAPKQPSSSPSNGAVIGAVVGSIIGFIILLLLIARCIRTSDSDWAPYLGSSRSSFSSIWVRNPNAVPVVARTGDFTATTQVVRESETRTFFFTRPSRKSQQHDSVRQYPSGSDVTSASSESSI